MNTKQGYYGVAGWCGYILHDGYFTKVSQGGVVTYCTTVPTPKTGMAVHTYTSSLQAFEGGKKREKKKRLRVAPSFRVVVVVVVVVVLVAAKWQ